MESLCENEKILLQIPHNLNTFAHFAIVVQQIIFVLKNMLWSRLHAEISERLR